MNWGAHHLEKFTRELAEARAVADAHTAAPSSARIQHIRRRLRLSQNEFAVALGVSAKTLQGWEQGRPVPKAVFILAELIRDFPVVRRKLLPGKGG